MKYKNLLILFFAFALSSLSVHVNATVLLNEHFNQATATLATNDNNGTIGADWTNITGSGNIYMNDADLTYSGYKSSSDDTKSIEYKATYGKKVAKSFTSKNSGSIYAAAIVKVSSCGASSVSNSRNYLWTFCDATSTNVGTVGYHFGMLRVQKTDTKFQFGVAKNNENALCLSYTDELEYDTPYLVVLEYKFVDGSANDIVYLYVNPTKGDKPEATIQTKQSALRPSDNAEVGAGTKADPSSLVSFVFNNTSSGSSGSKWNCLIDELKVVTDWADLWETGGDPEPDPITPPSPAASSITLNSATISWAAVEDADSYVLQWKVNGGSYSSDIAIDKDVRSYSMSGLESETTYYVRVKTIIGEDASDWAEINFNTSSEPDILVYKDISFNKYSTQDAMPTSGQVFLAKDIDDITSPVTLTGDLTLNLHGRTLLKSAGYIIVPSGMTLTIYDDAGTGQILGGFGGYLSDKGLITIKEGGTLVIGEGKVINLDDEDYGIALDSYGTLKLSGEPVISGVKEDIHLNSNAITIESGKPLTNSTPYKVYRLAGSPFTSGWPNMGGANPSLFFTSASTTHKGIILNGEGEAELVVALALDEAASTNESRIAAQLDQPVVVAITRSLLTNASFNTICLPFDLSNAELEDIFGAGYNLEEFESSEIVGDELVLTFNKVTALEAGKPYLLQPANNVTNPVFAGVTIGVSAPLHEESDTYISFHGVFNPTELTGGNKNLLFLGANNELFWPASTGNIKGFRAYFEVKGAARQARAARIAKREGSATGVGEVQSDKQQGTKILRNGQLYIMYNGTMYDVQGRRIND